MENYVSWLTSDRSLQPFSMNVHLRTKACQEYQQAHREETTNIEDFQTQPKTRNSLHSTKSAALYIFALIEEDDISYLFPVRFFLIQPWPRHEYGIQVRYDLPC